MTNGTVVCAVRDGEQNDDAVAHAVAVSERLGLRLVLAYVADGVATPGNDAGNVSVPVVIAPPRNGADDSYYERQKERAFRSFV